MKKECLRFILAISISGVCLVSCKGTDTGTGDVAPVLKRELRSYGANVRARGILPKLDCSYALRKDDRGFTVDLMGIKFEAIENFMTNAFGQPQIVADKNSEGLRQRVYAAKQIGAAVSYVERSNKVEVIGIRAIHY